MAVKSKLIRNLKVGDVVQSAEDDSTSVVTRDASRISNHPFTGESRWGLLVSPDGGKKRTTAVLADKEEKATVLV